MSRSISGWSGHVIDREEAERRRARGRMLKGMYKSRYGIIKEARQRTPAKEIEFYDPSTHLPPMPPWYARYRATKAWTLIELNFRRSKSSICDDCQKFHRGDVYHTSNTNIWPHDDKFLTLLCPPCALKRMPLKPAIVKIQTLHTKQNRRQALHMKTLRLESET